MKTQKMKLDIPAWMHVLSTCDGKYGSLLSKELNMTQPHTADIIDRLKFFQLVTLVSDGRRKIITYTQNGEVIGRACRNLIFCTTPVWTREK